MRNLVRFLVFLLPSTAAGQDLRPIPDLLAQLRDRDRRVFAAHALAGHGAAALPGLIQGTRDADPMVRRWALWSVGLVGGAAADEVPAVVARLDDPWCAPIAPTVLARIGAPALPALRSLLAPEDRRRPAAAIALARMALPEATALVLPLLLEDLGDPSRAAQAVLGLCALGAEADQPLQECARGAGFAAGRARAALKTRSTPDALRRSWSEPPIAERVRKLWPRWYAPGESLPRLLDDLARGEAWVRREAAWELRKRTQPEEREPVLAALRGALALPRLHPAAATSLACLGVQDDEVLAGLRVALADEELRPFAARQLATVATADEPGVLPALLEQLLAGPLFGDAANLIARQRTLPDEAVPVLVAALREAPSMAGADALALCDLLSAARPLASHAVPVLTALLAHRAPPVRSAAADRLRAFGPRAAVAADALARALDGPAPVAESAALALLGVAPRAEVTLAATARLLQVLELPLEQRFDPEWPHGSQRIARLFVATGDAHVPALRTILGSPDLALRTRACLVLGRLPRHAQPAVDELLPCLTAPDPGLRAAAAWALGALRAAPARVLPALVAALPASLAPAQPPWQYRADGAPGDHRFAAEHSVAWAVVQFGTAATPLLVRRLRDSDPDTTAGTAWLLGMLGPAAASAAPAVVQLLQRHADALVRRTAAWTLEAIGPQRVFSPVPDLARALLDPPVRPLAIHALAAFAPGDPAAVTALVNALPDEGPMFGGLRVAPIALPAQIESFGVSLHTTLFQLGDRVVPALRQLADRGDPAARAAAEQMLVSLERWQRTRGK